MPFQLPDNFNFDLPDLNQLSEGAIGSAESGFLPGTTIARTTDEVRERSEQVYREQRNTIANLQDGVQLVGSIVKAGIEMTILGQSLIKYQTGVEKIRMEGVKLQKAQTETRISQAELQQSQLKLGFETQKIGIFERGYQHQLRELEILAETASRKADKALVDLETKYPVGEFPQQQFRAA